ncbi:hypothetical protein INT44_008518, partial [Umbelopsis vinacea]
MANATLELAFSMVGLVFWSFQLAPQVWKNWKLKSTEGLSTPMMIIWALSGIFLGNYNIGANLAVPLWIQPQIFAVIAYICALQTMYYQRKWSKARSLFVLFVICVISGAIEYGLVTAFRVAQDRQVDWVHWFFGVIPVVLIVVGFLPQYWDIFVDKRVHGVSHVFLAMDFLAFRDTFDTLDAVNYVAVAVLDLGIFSLYYIFEWYHKRKGRKASDVDVEKGTDSTVVDPETEVHHSGSSNDV